MTAPFDRTAESSIIRGFNEYQLSAALSQNTLELGETYSPRPISAAGRMQIEERLGGIEEYHRDAPPLDPTAGMSSNSSSWIALRGD